jgi:hypothetical protein
MTDALSFDPSSSRISPYGQRQEIAPARNQQVQEKLEETAGIQSMEQLHPARVNELQGYYNTTLDKIEQIKYRDFPDLEKLKKSDGDTKKDPKQAKEEQAKEEAKQAEAEEAAKQAQTEEDAKKAQQDQDAKKAKEEEEKKKKEMDIKIEVFFQPQVRAGDMVTPGRTIAHFDVQVSGKDADKIPENEKESIKKKAMSLVEKNSGRSMSLPADGNLTADSNMKIDFIAGNGKLEGGQRVLAVQGVDGSKPFESYMKQEGGDELAQAKKYLKDNPDAPDAQEVKNKIDKMEKQQAGGLDFSIENDEEKEKKNKTGVA